MTDSDETKKPVTTTGISRRRFAQGMAATPLALGAAARGLGTARAQDSVKLVLLTHWGTQQQKDPLDAILAEYNAGQPQRRGRAPDRRLRELLNRITTGQLGGDAPGHLPLLQPLAAGLRQQRAALDSAGGRRRRHHRRLRRGHRRRRQLQRPGLGLSDRGQQLPAHLQQGDVRGGRDRGAARHLRRAARAAKALTKGSGDNMTQAGIMFLQGVGFRRRPPVDVAPLVERRAVRRRGLQRGALQPAAGHRHAPAPGRHDQRRLGAALERWRMPTSSPAGPR